MEPKGSPFPLAPFSQAVLEWEWLIQAHPASRCNLVASGLALLPGARGLALAGVWVCWGLGSEPLPGAVPTDHVPDTGPGG